MKSKTSHASYQHQRGTITDNHLQALVTDKLFAYFGAFRPPISGLYDR